MQIELFMLFSTACVSKDKRARKIPKKYSDFEFGCMVTKTRTASVNKKDENEGFFPSLTLLKMFNVK